MSKEPRIFIRIDPAEKAAAQAVCEARGSTLSEEVRAFLKRLAKRAAREAEQ